MTRSVRLAFAMIALACVISSSPSCMAQQMFWARCVPTSPREIWLHGRDLWKGSEYDTRSAKASINGVPLTWDRMSGANGHDANRALPFAHRFIIPDTFAPIDNAPLTFARNDGATATVTVSVPASSTRIASPAGKVRYIDAPIVIRPNETWDGGDDVITWAGSRTGPMIIVGSGATAFNARLFLPMGHDAVPCVSVLPGSGTILAGLDIVHHSARGVGIMLADQRGMTITDCKILANRCIECGPTTKLEDCNYLHLDMSSPRGTNDGQCGRAFQGSQHLIAWCHWHDIDRGPTIGPWGAPNDRSLYWECVQERTGTSQGASEGLLFEAFECITTQANVETDGSVIITTTGKPSHYRPGCFVVSLNGSNQWARIATTVRDGDTVTITTDQPLQAGQYDVRIGNAMAENTIARCRFSDGKSGLWLFGAAMNTAVIQCDFRDLDIAVVGLNRRNAIGCAFQCHGIDKFNQYRRVGKVAEVIP